MDSLEHSLKRAVFCHSTASTKIKMTFFRALLLLFFAAFGVVGSSKPEPYIIRSDAVGGSHEETTFSLCLGSAPSKKLRTSLLMCRDLSYPFCVNSSMIGTILRLDSDVAHKFTDALAEPTYSNIENLAWLVDSSLVVLYYAFADRANPIADHAYDWHAWTCSRVFERAHLNESAGAVANRRR